MGVKEGILNNLKAQWKVAVEKQFQAEPDKVRNSDVRKNAEEIMANPIVKGACKAAKIKVEDVERILTEIKNEVCISSNGDSFHLPPPNPFSHGRFEIEEHFREKEKSNGKSR